MSEVLAGTDRPVEIDVAGYVVGTVQGLDEEGYPVSVSVGAEQALDLARELIATAQRVR